SLVLNRLQLRHERRHAQYDGEQQSRMLQLISGMAKIRLSASEERAFMRWAQAFAKSERAHADADGYVNMQAALDACFGLVALLLFMAIVGDVATTEETQGMMAVGAFAAFLAAFHRFSGSITQLTQAAHRYTTARPLWERARPILTAVPE